MSKTWHERLLDIAKDVAPTVAGGAANGGNPSLGALVSSIMGKVGMRKYRLGK